MVKSNQPDDDDQASVANLTPSASNLRRFAGYGLWTVGAMAVSLGIDRLVVCPILKDRIGPAAFDGVVFVRALATLISNIACNGFRLYLVRNLVSLSPDEKRQFVRTAALLIFLIVAVAFPVCAWVTAHRARALVQLDLYALYIPFGIVGLARALELVIAVNLRVKRQFKKLFLVRLVEASALLSIVFLLPSANLWMIGAMYVISSILPLLLNLYLNRDIVQPGRFVDRTSIRVLLVSAPPGALLAAFETAQTLFPPLFLGALSTGEGQLTVLFAGMSIAYLFLGPAAMVSQLVLSLISGHREFELRAKQPLLYVGGTLLLAAVGALAAYGLGRLVLIWRWPDEAEEVFAFYHWVAVAIGCLAVRDMLKPFAVRYLPMRVVVTLSALPLVVLVIGLMMLVPTQQAAGAATALAISSVVGMLVWIVAFELVRRQSKQSK